MTNDVKASDGDAHDDNTDSTPSPYEVLADTIRDFSAFLHMRDDPENLKLMMRIFAKTIAAPVAEVLEIDRLDTMEITRQIVDSIFGPRDAA
jgi:hypothetical protein